MIIAFIKALPPIIAPIDNPTFARILTAIKPSCELSKKLFVSYANADMVVSDPQNPIAIKSAYLPSRFHCWETTTKIPRIKAPNTFTIKMFLVVCQKAEEIG